MFEMASFVQSPWVISGVFAIALYAFAVHYLKKKHPKVWQDLGEPALMHNDLSAANQQFLDYLIKGKFLKLPDPIFIFIGVAWYISFVIVVVTLLRAFF